MKKTTAVVCVAVGNVSYFVTKQVDKITEADGYLRLSKGTETLALFAPGGWMYCETEVIGQPEAEDE